MPDRTEPSTGPASAATAPGAAAPRATAPGASAPETESPAAALHRLEARIGRAAGAAERLIAEATASVASGPSRDDADPATDAPAPDEAEQGSADVPPAGWAPLGGPDRSRLSGELELLMRLAGRLAELVPPELRRQLADAMRELLLAVRALIDWYVARIERRTAEPPAAVDIPIL